MSSKKNLNSFIASDVLKKKVKISHKLFEIVSWIIMNTNI